MVCLDVLVIIRLLKHNRCTHQVIKPFNYSVVTLAIFIGLKLIYMAVLMAEDKSRYNDMNTILYETDTIASHSLSGYRSNSLIVCCFIHFQYYLKLKMDASGP